MKSSYEVLGKTPEQIEFNENLEILISYFKKYLQSKKQNKPNIKKYNVICILAFLSKIDELLKKDKNTRLEDSSWISLIEEVEKFLKNLLMMLRLNLEN